MLSHGGIKIHVKKGRRTLFHRFKLTLLIIQGEEDLFCPPLLLVELFERRRPFQCDVEESRGPRGVSQFVVLG